MKGITVQDLFKAEEIHDFDIHPNCRIAMCSMNRGRNWELAKLDLRTGRTMAFLSGAQSLTNAKFSPSGGLVAYDTDFEGDEDHDIVVVTSDGKRPKKITDGVADNSTPVFSPDGKAIAFVSNRDSDVENIFLIGVQGGRIRKLTHEALSVRQFAWSPDGSTIAYQSGVGDEDTIHIADVGSGRCRKVLGRRNSEFMLAHDYGPASPWASDSSSILYISNEKGPYDVGQLDLPTKKSRWLVISRNEKYQPQWSPDGKKLAYLEVEDPDLALRVRTGGRTKTVSPKNGVARQARWMPNGEGIVFLHGSSTRPQEVYVARTEPEKVTRFQPRSLEKELVFPKLVRFKSFDGRMIPALLFLPKDRSRRAGIVMPHGGPEMQTLNEWDQLPQMLADRGFIVIEPNYRGSTGYGHEFLHLHDKDHGGGDVRDTVWAGKHLIDSGLVDRHRLGYWGASYSGFTCMLAITKWPDMWAAAVSIVGFFDWETEIADERGYLKAYDHKKMGDPKRNPDFFHERSPINFLDSLNAPLLMTASAHDVRCPPTESRAVAAKLRRSGKPFVYHEYRDEGHWPRKRKNLIDLYQRSVQFLDNHVPK